MNAKSLPLTEGEIGAASLAEYLTPTAGLVVLAVSTEGQILYASPFLCGLAGFKFQELMGRSLFGSLFPAEHQARARQHFRGGANVASDEAVTIPIQTRGGARIPVRWKPTTARKTAAGETLIVVSGATVPEHMLREDLDTPVGEASADNQAMTAIGMWEFDLSSRAFLWSNQVHRIFETDPSGPAPLYDAFLDRVHPDDRNQVDGAFRRVVTTRDLVQSKHRLMLADDRTVWVEQQIECVFSSTDEPVLLRGAVRDLTDTIRAERIAQRNELMIASLLNVSPEAVLVTDLSGTIRTFSEGAEKIFRCGRERVVGQSISLLMPARFHAAHRGHLAGFGGSNKSGIRMGERSEIQARRLTGEEFPAEASVSKMSTGEGDLFAVILRDLSERKAYEAALLSAKGRAEAAVEAKSLFLATMSHEIRTPMNGVLGMLSVLATEPLRPTQKEMVQVAIEAGAFLMEILNDILDYSRIEAGGLDLEIAKFSLRDVLNKVHRLHGVKARSADISLELCVDDSVPDTLIGDPARIQQILHNLVGNAVKFTAEGGVVIGARYRAQTGSAGVLTVDVSDTGIGMSEAQSAAIFERFTQGDSSITRRFGGTGLGLSIVKGLIDAMEGEIIVESELGRGTRFEVTLPLQAYARPTATTALAVVGRRPSGRARTLKVLAVDEGGLLTEAIQRLLALDDVAVTTVRSGKETLRLYEPGRFDLVFLAMQGAAFDGEAALKIIRGLERAAGARNSLVVACGAVGDVERYRKLGFDGALSGAVDVNELLRFVSAAQARTPEVDPSPDAAN